jgi:hypothetical protein
VAGTKRVARSGSSTTSRPDPSAPKGRPTPGRKQRNAEARARARRRRLIVRAWWAALTVLVIGGLATLIMTGAGSGGI